MIKNILKRKKKISLEKWRELYVSHGITPEIVQEVASKENIKIAIPPDVYSVITEKDESVPKREEKKAEIIIDLSQVEGLPPTKTLYYEDSYIKEFDAKVLKILDGNGKKYVILDKTAFYPEGGGQPGDTGEINGRAVIDTQKVGQLVVHIMPEVDFSEGDIVHGKIDWERRIQLMRHHTATHILLGSARKVLGRHVWQWGSQLNPEVSRLDITHYQSLTLDEIEKISQIKPTYIAFEPPELIGTGKSVSKMRPEDLKRSARIIEEKSEGTSIPLCGAGISTKEDVRLAIKYGAAGILVASAFVKAKDRKNVLRNLAEAIEEST